MYERSGSTRRVVETLIGQAVSLGTDGVELLLMFLREDGSSAGESSVEPDSASTDSDQDKT